MGQFNNPIDPRGGPWATDPRVAGPPGHVLHGGMAQPPPGQGPVGAVTDPRRAAREAAAGAAAPEDPRRRDGSGGGDTRPADPRGSLSPPPPAGGGAGGGEARPRFGSGLRGLRERERERGREKDRDGPGGRAEGDRKDQGDGGERSRSPEHRPVEGARDPEVDRDGRDGSSHWPQPGAPPLQPQYPVAGLPTDPRAAGQVQASGMAYQPAAGQPVGAMGVPGADPRLGAAAAGINGQGGAAAPPAGGPGAEGGGVQGPGGVGASPGGGRIEQLLGNLDPQARLTLMMALQVGLGGCGFHLPHDRYKHGGAAGQSVG